MFRFRATNMFMALAVVTDVLSTRIGRAILVTGGNEHIKLVLFYYFLYPYYRQLLLCRVALGKSFFQFSAMKMAHAPPGHHSVVGRPSVGGLSFPEYVIYRGEQVTNTSNAPIINVNIKCQQRQDKMNPFLGLPRVSGQLSDCQT